MFRCLGAAARHAVAAQNPGCSNGRAAFFTMLKAALLPPEPQVLYQAVTPYNIVRVLEVPKNIQDPTMQDLRGSRILLLDKTGFIHSVWTPEVEPTKSYLDVMATLPGIVPDGTLGILGLGAGTVARLVHRFYPGRHMAGWELDPVVLQAGRQYMGMGEVEREGALVGHPGDALSPEAGVQGGFAGVMVDVFAEGSLPETLTQAETWEGIKQRLAPVPGARVIANLGQSHITTTGEPVTSEAADRTLRALTAMSRVFEGQVSFINYVNDSSRGTQGGGENCLAMTGPWEGLQHQWAGATPAGLDHLPREHMWQRFTPPPAAVEAEAEATKAATAPAAAGAGATEAGAAAAEPSKAPGA